MEFRTSNNVPQFQKSQQPSATVGALYNTFVRILAKFIATETPTEPKREVHSNPTNPTGRQLSCASCVNEMPCRPGCKCECHPRSVQANRDVPDAPDPWRHLKPTQHSVFNCALNGCGKKFGRLCDCVCH